MERKSLLELVAIHPVAMNIIMFVVLAIGAFTISRINVQFFPRFDLNFVHITTVWPGAAAEDVERSITNRMELELKNLDNLKDMTSNSKLGLSSIVLEFQPNTDMAAAANDATHIVEQLIGELPEEAERPNVVDIRRYEEVARLIISGHSLDQLRILANQYRDELLAQGIEKITITGLPDEEIAIQIPGQNLRDLGLSLNQIGQRIRAHSQDASVGISGRDDAARQLRVLDQRRNELSFEELPIVADSNGRLIRLSDIATIERRPKNDQLFLSFKDRPAVELKMSQFESGDTLESAAVLYNWIEQTRPTLPTGVDITVYSDQSVALRDRLNVLINNGLIGLLLVLVVLYLFLNARLAFWVAAGIPVALFGAVAILYLVGGTLNMITLFGFIMTIGIIVDDAIVVGEEALTRFSANASPFDAAYQASRRLFTPILAASLTTIFAFMPVIAVSGIVGTVLGFIALVVICVVATSLIEAFLILPGHLRLSFEKIKKNSGFVKPAIIDGFFIAFRNRWYRRMLLISIQNPITVIALGVALLVLTAGLFASGRLNYSFFPTPELDIMFSNVSFNAGTPREKIDDYLKSVEAALAETEKELGGNLISSTLVFHGATYNLNSETFSRGSNYGSVTVELVQSDERKVRTTEFLRLWRSKLKRVPGLESVVVLSPSAGPPGRDIEVRFSGATKNDVKDATVALVEYLQDIPGVYGVQDNTGYGRQQQILSLTPVGETLGLSVSEVSRQLRASIEGELLQSFTTPLQDIDVKVMLPREEKRHLSEMENIHVILPSGEPIALLDVVEIRTDRGFDTLRHSKGEFAIEVTASVDSSIVNLAKILERLETEVKPEFTNRYGINWIVGTRQADQEQTEKSMKAGALVALVMIYLTLALIFASYAWPLIVMLTIPFGIVGAAWGHLILGLDVTILTILGLIGLSGIVVNNAIVLVVYYKQNRDAGQDLKDALLDAGCQRLRPIILSSLTTIVGLLPLLFEKSTQAQFLIPMAATLVFGLAFSTLLVLFFIPAVLALYERAAYRMQNSETSVQLAEQGGQV